MYKILFYSHTYDFIYNIEARIPFAMCFASKQNNAKYNFDLKIIEFTVLFRDYFLVLLKFSQTGLKN